MKASFIGKGTETINHNHRKDKGYTGGYVGIAVDENGIHEAVDVRTYETKSRVYACAWMKGTGEYVGGSGYASGYGYNMNGAAVDTAIRAAGFILDGSAEASGISDAVEAVTRSLFPAANFVHVVHAHA
jgi:hypothetical protein